MPQKIIRIPVKPEDLVDFESALDESWYDTIESRPQRGPAATTAELRIEFSLDTVGLDGWTNSIRGYPSTSIEFNVPDADKPRVAGWFTGHYTNDALPASDTLKRNVTSSVKGALDSYFTKATGLNLFTAPFRVGWAFRTRSGKRTIIEPVRLMTPVTFAPPVAIIDYSFLTGAAKSTIDIINRPSRLMFRLSAPIADSFDWGDITHIDFIAAPQAELIPAPFQVYGVTTIIEEGTRYKSFRYDRSDSESLLANANAQYDFRVIGSISVSALGSGVAEVPLSDGALANWKLLTKYKSDPSDPSEPSDPSDSSDLSDQSDQTWNPYIDKITAPLDLGYPDRRKWIGSVGVRGCFVRSGALRVRIYGSLHRQRWMLIADSSRADVHGMALNGYRWFRVRITGNLRKCDYIDAITFLVRKSRRSC